jgi:hypothetical protein
LDEQTICEFLPEIKKDLDGLLIAQKTDYYRIALLNKYGGIWIDADTVVMRDFDEIFEKLDQGYDFVGFGCSGDVCFDGNGVPSNGVLAARPGNNLFKRCLQKIDEKLDSASHFDYFDLGKHVIWSCMREIKDYEYFHFDSRYDGSRDVNGKWIDSHVHFGKKRVKLLDEDRLFFVFLANSGVEKDFPGVKDWTKDRLLNADMWVSDMFRKSLK